MVDHPDRGHASPAAARRARASMYSRRRGPETAASRAASAGHPAPLSPSVPWQDQTRLAPAPRPPPAPCAAPVALRQRHPTGNRLRGRGNPAPGPKARWSARPPDRRGQSCHPDREAHQTGAREWSWRNSATAAWPRQPVKRRGRCAFAAALVSLSCNNSMPGAARLILSGRSRAI